MPDENNGKGTLKEFVDRLNRDPVARAQFLSNPVEILRGYGITLSKSAEEGLMQILEEYRKKIGSIRELQGKTITTTTTTTTTTETKDCCEGVGYTMDFI